MWANAWKIVAIAGTVLISYLGMRLWVFVSKAQKKQTRFPAYVPAYTNVRGENRVLLLGERSSTADEREPRLANEGGKRPKAYPPTASRLFSLLTTKTMSSALRLSMS